MAGLSDRLPPGDFRCVTELPDNAANQFALGYLYGQYRYDRYRRPAAITSARGAPGRTEELQHRAGRMRHIARFPGHATSSTLPRMTWVRASWRAKPCVSQGVRCPASVITGAELLEQNFPLIHAVGRASSRPPCLADFRWGERGPRIALVGKGVCFDSGGLDLKNAQSMLLMKKDMGGAACVLALARMIMEARLPVRLRVLIPAVENSVGADAYRPGDVVATRKGFTVEIGNTDAEGRLVLADAITAADCGVAGPPDRPGDVDRRGARRARTGAAGSIRQRRVAVRSTRCATARNSMIRSGQCRLWSAVRG